MQKIFFDLDVTPTPQARPRLCRNGFIYDPCAKSKKQIAALVKKKWGFDPIEVPLSISFKFFMPVPKSVPKKKADELIGQPHVKRSGDIDNIIKKILDAMNSIVYLDDCQVWRIRAEKIYGESGKIEVLIVY